MTINKSCENCKYKDLMPEAEPCRECVIHGRERPKWESAEAVNHPSHYNQGKYECVDVMVETFGKEAAKNFCLLNAFKYVWRTGEKNGKEDIKKAIWYLNKILELEGERNEQSNAGTEGA